VKHDSHIKALDCGDEIADWLERYLRKDGFRMYYHHLNSTQRTFEPYMYDCPDFKLDHMVIRRLFSNCPICNVGKVN